MRLLWSIAALSAALAQNPPAGEVVASVTCAADPTQSYALYVPRAYTPARAWPVIFGFDPGGRGRNPVERYQAAAEQYGFIVAGSNNSRNGSPQIGKAVAAMTEDVAARFAVDPKRTYLVGMSGGARVALAVALGSPHDVAGVIASSAGYPDSRPRKTLPFPIFATAGTEDFNHFEMRQLDRALTSPHRLEIFEGGHTWLSSNLATEAVEWMQVQAMKTGVAPRDERQLDQIFAKRTAAIPSGAADKDTFLALQGLVSDFEGLRDVSGFSTRLAVLGRDKSIRSALNKDRDEDDREERTMIEIRSDEARLSATDQRLEVLSELKRRWKDLSEKARVAEDSPERRFARRVLNWLSAGMTATDPDYLRMIAEYRPRAPGR